MKIKILLTEAIETKFFNKLFKYSKIKKTFWVRAKFKKLIFSKTLFNHKNYIFRFNKVCFNCKAVRIFKKL